MIEFFVSYEVRPKGNSKRAFVIGGFARVVGDPKSMKNAKSLEVLCAEHRPSKPLEGPLRVTYRFQFPWRKGDSRKRREPGAQPHDVRPDLGNLCKQLDDVLEAAGFFGDDAQIATYGNTEKVWTDCPGVHVRIEPLRIKSKE